MECPQCHYQNREASKFCGSCGTALASTCPSCGNHSLAGALFCDHCGTRFSAPALASEALNFNQPQDQKVEGFAPGTVREPEAERRQVTVMFVDLVESTKLSTQLDPEEMRDVIGSYYSLCAREINDLDGWVGKYLGDGILAYFGWPKASEDSAERAVRAGLAIVGAAGGLRAPRGEQLAARVGIETGLVVVGDVGGEGVAQEHAIVGQTPNLAARLQNFAPPNSVVIGEQAARLVRGSFELETLGKHTLKGFSTPVLVYRVHGESRTASRFDRMTTTTGVTPLVGREPEVSLLFRCWEQAKQGMGQAVTITGEAGIGKSRLSWALAQRLDNRQALQQFFQCSPYHTNSAFYPIITNLESGLRFEQDVPPGAKLDRLEQWITEAGCSVEDTAPLLAPLLSSTSNGRYPSLNLSPQRQKEKTIEAWRKLLLSPSRLQPMFCVFEDLHWSDPTTLEAVDHLVKHLSDASVLVVITYRPELVVPWAERDIATSVNLTRLVAQESEEIVNRVAGGKTLPAEVLGQIISKTDGVPLFVEELTKTVLESGLLREEGGCYTLAGQLAPLAIPSTLQDSLMARLDRLSPVKQIAQWAAAIGREFSYELLEAVAPISPEALQEGLSQLSDSELIYPKDVPPHATYIFKHALVQDTAYQSLLKSRRLQVHRRIAEVLTKTFPNAVETQPELIAHHFTEAGLAAQAVLYWQRAGQQAIERSAYVEGINYLNRMIELLGDLPDTAVRIKQECEIQISLGRAWTAIKGYAALEAEQAFSRALALSQKAEEPRQYFTSQTGLWAVYMVRGEYEKARKMAEELLRIAQNNRDPSCLETGHRTLGIILAYMGRLVPARTHLEQTMRFYKFEPGRFQSYFGLTDAVVLDRCHLAIVLWALGFPDQAVKLVQEAVTHAKKTSHPYSLAYALNADSLIHVLRRDWGTAQKLAENCVEIATEQRLMYLSVNSLVACAVSVAMQQHEQGEVAVKQINQALAGFQSEGASVGQNYALAQLLQVYWKLGRNEEGRAILARALELFNMQGGDWWELEVHRIGGELELQRANSDPRKAEAYFQQALAIARREQGKGWELRVVISLSRLWKQQGKQQEARRLLSEIYSWFSEGFDTADLKEAKELLDELT